MPNQHITQFLNYYIKLPNPQYGVLLKGKWGSGKTHFINEYKKSLDANNEKYIYISLYGVTSYDEIETRFLQATNPEIFNEKTIFVSKVANALITEKIKGSLKEIKKSLSSLNAKERILIFDDIERCSLKIVDLLGFINNFVEHQSYKVILIANEEELNKTKKYKKIKEKLIGKTFEFKSSPNDAYDSFLDELDNEEIIKKYKDTIIEVFKKSECNNLRLLRQGLLDFKRVYDLILKEYTYNNKFIEDFIVLYFIFIFETRSGYCLSIKNLIESSEKYWDELLSSEVGVALGVEEKKDKKKTVFDKIYKKYNISIHSDIIFSLETWQKLIEDSCIVNEKISNEILKSKYFINENTESWKRLWSFLTLDDENFDDIFNDVIKNLDACKYQDLFQVMLISSTILDIKRKNLTGISLDKLYVTLKKQIDYIFEKKLTEEKYTLNGNYLKEYRLSYDSLGFDIDFLEYKKIGEYIENKIQKEKEIIFKNSFFEIENAMNIDYSKLYTLLSHGSGKINYHDKPIFAFMDMDKLAKLLIESSSHSQYTFGGIIEDRYKHAIFTSSLEDEFDNLYKLNELIKKEANNKNGKISGYRLKQNLLEPFKKAISYIESYKDTKTS